MRDVDEEFMGDYASPRVREQSAAVVQIENGKWWPLVAVCCLISGIAIALAIWAMTQAERSERETRMLEYYVLELDGKLMHQGLIEQSRSYSAQKQQRGDQK